MSQARKRHSVPTGSPNSSLWSNLSQRLTTQGTHHRGHMALSHTPRGFAGDRLAAHLTAQGVRTGSTRPWSGPGATREAWRDPGPSWSLCMSRQRGCLCTARARGRRGRSPQMSRRHGRPDKTSKETSKPPAMKLGRRGQRQLEVPT